MKNQFTAGHGGGDQHRDCKAREYKPAKEKDHNHKRIMKHHNHAYSDSINEEPENWK